MAFQKFWSGIVLIPFSVFIALLFTSCNEHKEVVSDKEESEHVVVDETSGKRLFEKNCTACHGCDGKAGLSGAKDLSVSNLTEKEVLEIVRNGKNGMPPFGAILGNNTAIGKVIEHVKSLRK